MGTQKRGKKDSRLGKESQDRIGIEESDRSKSFTNTTYMRKFVEATETLFDK